jgi:RNA polymerase sigma factor (sigma-70 family)
MIEEKKTKTDQALIMAFIGNADEMVFSEIVQRHGPMVYRVCFRILSDHHEAEDAAQVVFAILVKKARSIRKQRSLGSWLHGVARATALYSLRNHVNRKKREEEVAMYSQNMTQVANEECRSEVFDMMDEAVAQLSKRQREAIVLRHLQGHSVVDAAFFAGCSPEALKSRTSDGIATLRKFFTKRGVAVGALLVPILTAEANASVPQSLLPSILTTSQSVAAGAATEAVSDSVLSLTKGVMKMIMWQKMAMTTGVICAFMVTSAVVGITVKTLKGNAVKQKVSPSATYEKKDKKRPVQQKRLVQQKQPVNSKIAKGSKKIVSQIQNQGDGDPTLEKVRSFLIERGMLKKDATLKNVLSLKSTQLKTASNEDKEDATLKDVLALKSIQLKSASNEDLKYIAKLENVHTLSLSGFLVTDLSALSGMEKLTVLSLRDTSVSDLSVLPNVEKLYLNGASFRDLNALSGMENVDYLELFETSVSDLSPLDDMQDLKYLQIRGRTRNNYFVSDQEIMRLKRVLPNCNIYVFGVKK